MPYVTLLEASQVVQNETGVDITAPQLIRVAAVQHLPLCVLLDVKCYSPTHKIRREKKAEELVANYWRNCPAHSIDSADVVDAYGLFVLPPRHVFAYQTNEMVRIQSVSSLDGQDIYFPFVVVSRDQIQITLCHLAALVAQIKTAKADTQSQPTITSPAPVVVETVEQRRARYLAMFEAEEKREKRGALQRVADSEGVDRSDLAPEKRIPC